MSIYATILTLGTDHHEDDCAAYIETSADCFELTGKPCDCRQRESVPLEYQGSHILPSPDDKRVEWGEGVEIAEIPFHITRDGRDVRPESAGPWPYLRLSVDDSTVVLTREQVVMLSETLTGWLNEVEPVPVEEER